MSRQRNHSIIAIFSVLTMQSECLSFDMDITDSEIGHLSRADEEVVDDLTCKEIVPVVLHQIISDELHGAVRYDISAFLLPVLDTFQTFFDELTFLNCRFSERKVIKTERISKILVSAIKQSLKARLPQLNEMTDFNKFITQPFLGQKFIAHCYEGEKPLLKDMVHPGEDALVLIGPEGDFSEEEVRKATENDFIPISLGKSRLRTETAALVACHILNLQNQ